MVALKFFFALVNLIVFALGDGTIAELAKILADTPDGLMRLQEYIGIIGGRNQVGIVGRDQEILYPPRHDYGITKEDVEQYLDHSLLAQCTQRMITSGLCFCKGKFYEANAYGDSDMESRSVVAVDLRNKLIVVSYRLSVTDKNWNTNDEIQLVNYPTKNGEEKVHLGHYKYFQSVKNDTEAQALVLLKNHLYKNFTLHVTGYSLGGSVTGISMPSWLSFLKKHGLKNKARFFGYAGPRPGNLAYARYLETLGSPIIRYAKKGDIVPHLPDMYMGDFSQVGLEFYDPGTMPFGPNRLKKCSRSIVQDVSCGLGDSDFAVFHHLTPFNRPLPIPPFC
ncbi:hypothetical protein DSO57_1031070 [Entomophthora muscae]|uniref:Uncharacterized protein n=2 Tax=Entomophthora muscae TaxID=34485 RepID=A0ACC2T3T1_9FUNG|nr:hypothetical protein DSO57_1019477 [Entomophthora muscae]KAJ9072059.1 hypothetical protein DSO57_1031070 [Entomophthora muscae]